jgi:uncharacterized membrane protein
MNLDISSRERLRHTPARDRQPRQNVGQLERIASAGVGAGLLLAGLKRGSWGGWLLAAGGAALIYRGASGHCGCYDLLGYDTSETRNPATAVAARQGRKIERSIAINRAPEELYETLKDVEHLPRIFDHLTSVSPLEEGRARWQARGPLGNALKWDAEVIRDRPNQMISWRSLDGGDVETAGSIHLRPLPAGRGTEMRISLKYNPPGGKLAANVTDFLGQGLEAEIQSDLRRFKQLMEAGEPPTTKGQPSGPRSP